MHRLSSDLNLILMIDRKLLGINEQFRKVARLTRDKVMDIRFSQMRLFHDSIQISVELSLIRPNLRSRFVINYAKNGDLRLQVRQ
jgi:hypothetical protein